ncbi:glycine--tRNA ligase [Candidatus Bathyarchaeota archaeon]|nr:glycine--tRNA ligase [Candidatus Bathyarchaeota archaeon]
MPQQSIIDKVNDIAKRRGFFWPSYEIYGGVAGFLTIGPLGTILKRNIENKFRDTFIRRLGFLEIETSVIVPGKVFEASGHVEHFKEPMVECKKCTRKFRADHLLQEAGLTDTETEKMGLKEIEETIRKLGVRCPECGGEFREPRYFLTMFETTIGPYSKNLGYGRPEAAQGIFTEYKRVYEAAREKLPIGIVQIGHALRNEISPRQGPIRLREFTIIDLEFFFDPSNPKCSRIKEVEDELLRLVLAENKLRGIFDITEMTVKEALNKGIIKNEWLAFFMALAKNFLIELGIPDDKQRFIEKLEWERAHYSVQGFDQEVYLDRLGWVEVSGHNYRTDYDLKRHMLYSGVDLRVYKEFSEPIYVEEKVVKPLMSTIGPQFKNLSGEVVRLLSKADPDEVERAFREKGYYQVGEFRILPEHVKIVKEKKAIKGRKFIPHVIEPSFGSERLLYVTLYYSYRVKDNRTILSLPVDIAPIQVAVFPLVARKDLKDKALQIYRTLLDEGFMVEYDESASIGRRYARADEIGVPLAVTVDHKTLEDDTVTVRDRDSWRQFRISIEKLPVAMSKYFKGKTSFEELMSQFKVIE